MNVDELIDAPRQRDTFLRLRGRWLLKQGDPEKGVWGILGTRAAIRQGSGHRAEVRSDGQPA